MIRTVNEIISEGKIIFNCFNDVIYGQLGNLTKTAFVVLTILILITPGFALNSFYAEAQSTNDFLTYQNSIYSFKTQYPSDWVKDETTPGIVITFYSPLESDSDDFSENVQITAENLTYETSLEQYVDDSIQNIRAAIPNFEIVESSFITMGGHKGTQVSVNMDVV